MPVRPINLKPITSSIQQHWGNSNAEADRDLFTAIRDIETALKDIRASVNAIINGGLTISTGQQVFVKFFELRENITMSLPSEQPGSFLIYVIYQLSGNIFEVTFPPEFIGMFPITYIPAPNSWNSIFFYKHSNTEIVRLGGLRDVR